MVVVLMGEVRHGPVLEMRFDAIRAARIDRFRCQRLRNVKLACHIEEYVAESGARFDPNRLRTVEWTDRCVIKPFRDNTEYFQGRIIELVAELRFAIV